MNQETQQTKCHSRCFLGEITPGSVHGQQHQQMQGRGAGQAHAWLQLFCSPSINPGFLALFARGC